MNEDKASRYHRSRRWAELLGTAASAGFLLTLLVTGNSLYLRELGSVLGTLIGRGFEEPATVLGFAITLSILLQSIELPFGFYQGYVLEHRYGLSNQTFGQWTRDQVKGGLLSIAIAGGAASIIYGAIRWNATWWWPVSAAIFAIALVVIVQLAPVCLLPLFYSFKPLERPALVQRLMKLAHRARTRIGGVYEWALSTHTKKANAALAGVGRTRRILLSDTLLADYSDDEIEVVLAHELSHHVHHDLWRGMAFQTLLLFVGFFAAHLALVNFANTFELRGIDDPAGLPLLLLVSGACSLLLMPIANAFSRSHERRADRYALDATQQPAAFISAMKRLSQQNLAEEHPSSLVQWLFYSHPPIRDRIDAARVWTSRDAEDDRKTPVSGVA